MPGKIPSLAEIDIHIVVLDITKNIIFFCVCRTYSFLGLDLFCFMLRKII